jgi:hypothetical protein
VFRKSGPVSLKAHDVYNEKWLAPSPRRRGGDVVAPLLAGVPCC